MKRKSTKSTRRPKDDNPLFHDWAHNACAPSKPLGQWSQRVREIAARHAAEDERLGKWTSHYSRSLKRYSDTVDEG